MVASAQEPTEERLLEWEKWRAVGRPTLVNMIEIQAIHFTDGSPARGTISCNGYWIKFQDEKNQPLLEGTGLPFKTDSRGVIIMNPWVGMYDEEDPLICRATDVHGHTGSGMVTMPARKMLIQVR